MRRYLGGMVPPLISTDDLAGVIDAADVRVVDCRWYLGEPARGLAAFTAAHLPGAIYASLDEHLSGSTGAGRHPLPSPEAFARSMGRLGIDRSHFVVAYDDRGGAVAARLWWMLTAQGFDRVAVLDGGIPAWRDEGRPLTSALHDPVPVAPFQPVPWSGVVGIDDVAGRDDATVVLDARSAERYRGESEPVDPKAGHIPGAISLPLTEHLDAAERFVPAERIRERFAAAGVDASTRAIAQCGSGVTACHLVLSAELAGLPRPDLYVGSWSEWSSTDRPVATGPTP